GMPDILQAIIRGCDVSKFSEYLHFALLCFLSSEGNSRLAFSSLADIYFNITMRRKTLFYTVNLIIPSVGISYLSVLVFYLPADSGEKVVLCISVLLSQTIYFLFISEITPPTSFALPLLGRYLLFTMLMVALSVLLTVLILNIHYRKPSTHRMAPWVRHWFVHVFPKMLFMRVPTHLNDTPLYVKFGRNDVQDGMARGKKGWEIPPPPPPPGTRRTLPMMDDDILPPPSLAMELADEERRYPAEIERAIRNIRFIQRHQLAEDAFRAEDEDWAFVAMVLDRFFLYVFVIVSLVGTFGILLDSPALYDDTKPIDLQMSTIYQRGLGRRTEEF
ncbi:unnamed protein product, partial [Darwinula stevensoni]